MNINTEVHRDAGYWTKQVHEFLNFLRKKGFSQAPLPLGFDEQGREIVSFVQGQTCDYPLSQDVASKNALISSAILLRKYHDVSQYFLNEVMSVTYAWMLPLKNPQEVICHGDFAPYNICFEKDQAVGIIDFDTAHPGPRAWDIAYALYRFAPFTNPQNEDGFGNIEDQIVRARIFCESYELPVKSRAGLPNLMVERLRALLDFMIKASNEGNKKYQSAIQDGHHLKYLADIEYIKLYKTKIEKGLSSN